jgi:uncharacterized membrane protein (UPF0182 family)
VSRRRWLLGGVVALAALLLVGRVVAGWYVDFLWFDALGAADVWRARAVDLLILRGGAFVVGTLFVFLNLWPSALGGSSSSRDAWATSRSARRSPGNT